MRNFLLTFLLVFAVAFGAFSQTSKNNYTGAWGNSNSWTAGASAPSYNYGGTANIYGHIISSSDLVLNFAVINVYDTLVIDGNLTQNFISQLNVASGGLLVVLGNFDAGLFNDGTNNGNVAIMGTTNYPSTFGANGFTNNGSFYTQNSGSSSGISGNAPEPTTNMPSNLGNFVNSPAALPIELKDFYARKMAQAINLHWSTLTEKNFNHFEVERKVAGEADFKMITTVKGVGESTQLQEYQYTDVKAPYGSVYYRLKQVDNDGTFEYSPIVVVTRQAQGSWAAYPNPVNYSGKFQIRAPEGNEILQIALISPRGKVLWQKQEVTDQQVFSIPEEAKAGLYFVQIYTSQGQKTLKIIKP